MRRVLVGALVSMSVACVPAGEGGSSSNTPSTPSTPTPTTFTISGSVMATNGGQTLNGATVTAGGVSTTTDGSGRYSVTVPVATGPMPYSIAGGSLLQRQGFITAGTTRAVNLEAIVQDSSFDLGFYRQLVRDQFDTGVLRSLARWTANPNIYMRTIDSTTGRAVEPEVLALVTDWVMRSVPLWTGGQFRVGAFETGAPDRPDTPGWLVVEFTREPTAGYCGRSFVGRDPGRVTLNNDRCNCGSTKVPAGTVLHEFGHAMGFYHVPDRGSIMFPQDPGGCPLPALSTNEQRHSAIAYKRPVFNTDPDIDPSQSALIVPPPSIQIP